MKVNNEGNGYGFYNLCHVYVYILCSGILSLYTLYIYTHTIPPYTLTLSPSVSFKDWEDGATANKIELSAAFTEDWDDQTIEDDFANQLRAELQKMSK